MKYQLWNDDIKLLDYVISVLNEHEEEIAANDLELLRNRIKTMINN